jgi:type I restriction enzyme, S subunit
MNNETMMLLERHFDAAFAAPDGIKKLRELILTLAMQGKLVPQDPNDEPASELLKAIEVEKQRLIKEGKIKQPKQLSDIKLEEMPYELSKGWEWIRLGNTVSHMDAGWSPACDEVPAAINEWGVLKTTSVQPLCFLPHENKALPKKLDPRPDAEVKEGDMLITRAGPRNRVGICCVAKLVRPYLMLSDKIIRFRTFGDLIFPDYCVLCLCAGYGSVQIEGMKSGMADSQVNISQEKLKQVVIPLPPFAEQRRIVAEIDRLMARCDELEKLRADRSQKLLTVHTAALDKLLKAKENSDFSTAWHFITQNFSELYSVKENVTELRKAILQLAVMGKLVPQDPNDEPASELLKAIELEKQQLVKEGKIKKQKPLPEIDHDKMPCQLPNNWEWARFFTVNIVKSELVSARDYPSEKQIAPDSIEKGSGSLLFHRTVEEFGATGPNNKFYKGQILYSKIRPSLNKAVIAPYDGLCSADMYPIKTLIEVKFMLKIILSEMFLEQVRHAENRVKMPKLNLESLGIFQIPIPPLAEQHRIVAEIDRLMALCDRLEESIEAAKGKQTDLLNALMSQV